MNTEDEELSGRIMLLLSRPAKGEGDGAMDRVETALFGLRDPTPRSSTAAEPGLVYSKRVGDWLTMFAEAGREEEEEEEKDG